MSRIQQLSTHVINKIAAGEVIERPASVVKELLENSIDALATRIEVDIEQGGTELIRIVDDGEGIHPDDFLLAVSSHATSKISQADDLFQVRTLGFRGEALASIAEVSRFRLRSRTPDAPAGVELEVDCGQPGQLRPSGGAVGTLVEVRQLFHNTPVRRKFLKSGSTEFGHISEQFTRMALANPRLHLVLRHNGKPVYELPLADNLLDRIAVFFGGDAARLLIPIASEHAGVRLWGYVGHPSQSKSTRRGQYLFLNGRWIQDRSLQHALGEAYRGLLMVGRYPLCFLFLEIPPDQVDVNVHPTKAEVRFRDGQQLYRQLLAALRTKFLGMNLDSELRVAAGAARTGLVLQPTVNPPADEAAQREFVNWAKDRLQQFDPAALSEIAEDAALRFDEEDAFPPAPLFADAAPGLSPAVDFAGGNVDRFSREEGGEPGGAAGEAASVVPSQESSPREFRTAETAANPSQAIRAASDSPAVHEIAPSQRLNSDVRAIQIHDAYIVLETSEGLQVVDQHALHERILYEHLRARVLAGSVESQKLLLPETVELPPAEAALILEHAELLAQLGLGVAEFGGNTVLVTSYPAMLRRNNPVRIVRDVAEQLVATGQDPSRRDLLDSLLHMMSCKAAIKAGQRLAPEEIDALLAQRHLIDDAHHCPHGRPTALVLTRNELDRQFGRLG